MLVPVVMPAQSSAVSCSCRSLCPLREAVLAFLLVMTVYALFIQLGTFWDERNWLLLVLDLVILVAAAWVVVEALAAMRRTQQDGTRDEDADSDTVPADRE